MEFSQYIRKPFKVEAIEITDDNFMEIAKLVGEPRTKNGVAFIALDRRVVPNVSRAFVGWFMTKLGDNYRCYSPKVFNEQFVAHEPETGYFFDENEEDGEEVIPQVAAV